MKDVRLPLLGNHDEATAERVVSFVSTLCGIPYYVVERRVHAWLLATAASPVVSECAEAALETWPRIDVSPADLMAERIEAFSGGQGGISLSHFTDLPVLRPLKDPSEAPRPQALCEEVNRRRVCRAVSACWKIIVESRGEVSSLVRSARFGGLLVWPVYDEVSGASHVHLCGPLQALERTTIYARALSCVVLSALSCPGNTVRIVPTRSSASTWVVKFEDPVARRGRGRSSFDSALEKAVYKLLVRAIGSKGVVSREPCAVAVERSLVIPDFAVRLFADSPVVLIEVVGFWTEAYLARKREMAAHSACARLGFIVEATKAEAFLRGVPATVRERVFVFGKENSESDLAAWVSRLASRPLPPARL